MMPSPRLPVSVPDWQMTGAIALLNEDLESPRYDKSYGGQLAVFSRRCPGSTTANEDSALVISTDEGLVIAVADGAGGGLEGDKASRMAIQALRRHIERDGSQSRTAILDAFEESNAQVLGLGTGAATTLSVVELQQVDGKTLLRPYHCGDSSTLVTGGRGKVKLNTIPHSPVGYGVEAGLIEPQDALHHDDLNIVSNVIGISDMRVEMGSMLTLSSLDTVVLGSDGLFDNLQLWEIVQIARKGSLAKAARELADLATKRMQEPQGDDPSKPDDLTFILFRPGKKKKKRKSTPPAES